MAVVAKDSPEQVKARAAKYLADLIAILRTQGFEVEEDWKTEWPDDASSPTRRTDLPPVGIWSVNGITVSVWFEEHHERSVGYRWEPSGKVELKWQSRPRTTRAEPKGGFDLNKLAERIVAHVRQESAEREARDRRHAQIQAQEQVIKEIAATCPKVNLRVNYDRLGQYVLDEGMSEQEARAVAKVLAELRAK